MLPHDKRELQQRPTSWIAEQWKYYMTKDDALTLGKEATRRLVEVEQEIKRLRNLIYSHD